jgi:GR25 family glycosyltransferase involved in LPS biosynthesis
MVDHIYIVHYSPLIERKKYLLAKFEETKITNFTFYEKYNRNETSTKLMEQYFKLHNLNPAQICITIAHIEIYREILEKGYKRCLILEDDARLSDNFFTKLNTYNNALPEDFDLGFLNDGCGFHASNIQPSQIWYPATTTRTCCAYIISNKCCATLVPSIIPFTMAIDHELNIQIAKHNLKTFWAEPTIVSDGSASIYGSSYVYF